MKSLFIILSILLISVTSCKQTTDQNSEKGKHEIQQPVADFEDLISDYHKWWSYHYYSISLSSDFHALNEKSEEISKDDFLNELTSGNYITIEMQSNDDSKTYQLFKLPEGVDNGISSTIKNVSGQDYIFFKMEGIKFPDFNVVDVNGVAYNNEKFIGKTTVIKTWFIACTPCIAEMPELNEFVNEYRNEDRIQFLSLATDTKPLLLDFLLKRKFDYVVIAEQKELIQDKLNLMAYPTHLVVNEKGDIEKVFSKASELMSYIGKNESLRQSEQKSLPPPSAPSPQPTERSNENDANS